MVLFVPENNMGASHPLPDCKGNLDELLGRATDGEHAAGPLAALAHGDGAACLVEHPVAVLTEESVALLHCNGGQI